MTSLDTQDKRAHVHRMWAAVAPAWADHADDVDRRGAVMTQRLLDMAHLAPGERVLELASGPGGAGLAAAALVEEHGHVVITDVVPEMVAIAAARADAQHAHNVSTAVRDLEQIDEPDASFDVVLCREGLMFAVDPGRAAHEIRRVLRPGGRLALSVWGPRQANPWLGLVADAVTAVTGIEVPPPGMPGPFALSDRLALESMLAAAGFEITTEALNVPLRAASFEAWWARTRAVAGPLTLILSRLDEQGLAAIERSLRNAAAGYCKATGIELPGSAWLASGRAAI